jgi:hypothetical protein
MSCRQISNDQLSGGVGVIEQAKATSFFTLDTVSSVSEILLDGDSNSKRISFKRLRADLFMTQTLRHLAKITTHQNIMTQIIGPPRKIARVSLPERNGYCGCDPEGDPLFFIHHALNLDIPFSTSSVLRE